MQIKQEENILLSSQQHDRKQFSLGDASIILMLLTKQYSNPIKTLTQEYISNARDANREVGSKQKIKIVLPTNFRPILEIRDYGPGITPERMANVFVKIATSTKRDDNTQTGGFGIGAKSAWAYTDKFNIITYVDGYKRSYVAHYTTNPQKGGLKEAYLDQLKDTNGQLEIPTDEENGTVIQIPIKLNNLREFTTAVEQTLYFWKDEEYPEVYNTLDGEHLSPVELSRPAINSTIENLVLFQDLKGVNRQLNSPSKLLIVIDGISYRIPPSWCSMSYIGYQDRLKGKDNDDYIPTLYDSIREDCALIFDIGEIHISPTREGIIENEENKLKISQCSKKILDAMTLEATTMINSIKEYEDLQNFSNYISKYGSRLQDMLLKKLPTSLGIYKIDIQRRLIAVSNTFSNREFSLWTASGRQVEKSFFEKSCSKAENLTIPLKPSSTSIPAKHILLFDSSKMSEAVLKRRLKQFLIEKGFRSIVCIEFAASKLDSNYDEKLFNETIECLRKDFICINEVDIPKAVTVPTSKKAVKKTIGKDTLNVHTVDPSGGLECLEIKLDQGINILYLPYSEMDEFSRKQLGFVGEIVKKSISLSKSSERFIFGFIADGWLNKYKQSTKNIYTLIEFKETEYFKEIEKIIKKNNLKREFNDMKSYSHINLFSKLGSFTEDNLNNLEDKLLKKAILASIEIESIPDLYIRAHIPEWSCPITDSDVELSELRESAKYLIDYLKGSNSIVKAAIGYSSINTTELVDYINFLHNK